LTDKQSVGTWPGEDVQPQQRQRGSSLTTFNAPLRTSEYDSGRQQVTETEIISRIPPVEYKKPVVESTPVESKPVETKQMEPKPADVKMTTVEVESIKNAIGSEQPASTESKSQFQTQNIGNRTPLPSDYTPSKPSVEYMPTEYKQSTSQQPALSTTPVYKPEFQAQTVEFKQPISSDYVPTKPSVEYTQSNTVDYKQTQPLSTTTSPAYKPEYQAQTSGSNQTPPMNYNPSTPSVNYVQTKPAEKQSSQVQTSTSPVYKPEYQVQTAEYRPQNEYGQSDLSKKQQEMTKQQQQQVYSQTTTTTGDITQTDVAQS